MLLRTGTERMTLAVFRKEGLLNERRRKAGQREHPIREGHEVSAGSVKTFRTPAMSKKAPLDCKRNTT